MTPHSRPILDAGPGLNFFSIKKERLLIATLGPLSAPAIVGEEIQRKARQDTRFERSYRVWKTLSSSQYLEVLSDEATDELSAAVSRISDMSLADRFTISKDLGETMVIAHAVVLAEQGKSVTVLIDDGAGQQLLAFQQARLERLRAAGHNFGDLNLITTLTVLERAAGSTHIPDKATMRKLYERLRGLDDGLPPITHTQLLAPSTWS